MTTTMTTMMTTMTTMTKPQQTARPVGSWTKQVVSFGTSFAFFGLAGFLQHGAFAEAAVAGATVSEPVAITSDVEMAAAGTQVAVDQHPVLLGPVQPLDPSLAVVSQPEPIVEVTPAPAPAPCTRADTCARAGSG